MGKEINLILNKKMAAVGISFKIIYLFLLATSQVEGLNLFIR